jgi:hypothetical protein
MQFIFIKTSDPFNMPLILRAITSGGGIIDIDLNIIVCGSEKISN